MLKVFFNHTNKKLKLAIETLMTYHREGVFIKQEELWQEHAEDTLLIIGNPIERQHGKLVSLYEKVFCIAEKPHLELSYEVYAGDILEQIQELRGWEISNLLEHLVKVTYIDDLYYYLSPYFSQPSRLSQLHKEWLLEPSLIVKAREEGAVIKNYLIERSEDIMNNAHVIHLNGVFGYLLNAREYEHNILNMLETDGQFLLMYEFVEDYVSIHLYQNMTFDITNLFSEDMITFHRAGNKHYLGKMQSIDFIRLFFLK